MITVFKNLGICITVFGDYLFFGAKQSKLIKLSIIIILIGSACAGITDLTFTLEGYAWMLAHMII